MRVRKGESIKKLFSKPQPLRLKLGTRITLSIGLLVGLVSLIVFFLLYYIQQRQVLEQTETEAKSLLTAMMLVHEWAAGYEGVWTDQPGEVYFEEQNGFYQKTPAMVTKELTLLLENEGFYRFHLTGQQLKNPENAPLPSEEQMLEILAQSHTGFGQIEELDGERVYHYMTPLLVEESCTECHTDQQPGELRGGLSVFLPLQRVDATLAQNRWLLTLSAAMIIILLMASLYLLVRRLIVVPIGHLKAVTTAVANGNYQARSRIMTGDELEALGQSINQMVTGLKTSRDGLEANVAQRTNELLALSEIAFTISHTQTLPKALNEALEAIFAVTPAKGGAIHLLNDDQKLELIACRNLSQAEETWLRELSPGQCIPGHVTQANTFIHQADLANCTGYGHCNQHCPLNETGWELISAPLKSKNRILGAVTLIAHPPHTFPQETAQLLECIGHQLGVGVENARFHEQAGQVAILEERGRLARELHDNLAQTIGYLNLNTRIITDMVKGGQYNEAQQALEDMRQSTRNAYEDLRWAIFDLRTPLDGDHKFGVALQTYLEEFEVQTGLTCHLTVNNVNHLSPNVRVQLFRIVQEAMHNVRKHAQAQNIWVDFGQQGNTICLRIEDDGIGIDQDRLDPATHHFGLHTMRERAEAIGWQLEIGGRTAGGTRIEAQRPSLFEPSQTSEVIEV